ncbi:MAG TPA: amidohydrolase family protein, partial [Acetobacteraceae bacterium]|nr:amidohydrolase family protein [Acetobacteraceae bacterium]
MATHFDLLIRNGTCVLPWGIEATTVGVRNGRIAALGVGADATADQTIDASGLHVLPGLIDPHVHLRDPGDKAVETIPTGTKAAVLGGLAMVFDMPNTSPSIVDTDRLAWKQDYVEQVAWCDMGLYVGGTKTNIPALAELERGRGVCGIKIFAGSSSGDLLVEDDEHLEKVMRAGRRRIAYHSEDEYRLQARRPMFKSGDPYSRHMEWRDEECAFLGTRRLMALARKTGRPAHILHVST